MTTLNPLPFNVQAPLPPHFVYGTGISTYMDHFGRKKEASRRRMVTPPRMSYKPDPKDRIRAHAADPGVPSRQAVKEAVHDYVNKLSTNNKAVYNAMAPVFISNPYQESVRYSNAAMVLPPQWPPTVAGKSPIITPRSSAGRNAIIEEARKSTTASVVTWKRPQTAAPCQTPARPSTPGPAADKGAAFDRVASAPMPQRHTKNAHWIFWDTGDLEPPGLQTRLVRPWPTPPPPPTPRSAAPQSKGVAAQASRFGPSSGLETRSGAKAFYTRRSYANYPVPDDIAMQDLHDTMLRKERVFLADPESIDRDKRASYYAPNPLLWCTRDDVFEGDPGEELRVAEMMAGDVWRPRDLQSRSCLSERYLSESDTATEANEELGQYEHLLRERTAEYNARKCVEQQQMEKRHLESRTGIRSNHRMPQRYVHPRSYDVQQKTARSSKQHSEYTVKHFDDGVNYGSTFMYTEPFRGTFVINPEWTSERAWRRAEAQRRAQRLAVTA